MKKLSFLLILLILLSSGCSLLSTDKKKKHYYQIYYKGRPVTTESVDASIFVRTVEVNQLYKRSNLIYRDSAFELFYYYYHYWAVRPQNMLADVIFHHLQSSNIVSMPLAELDRTPDYTIVARLIALDEIDSGDQWFARISMTFALVNSKTDEIMVGHTFDERQEVLNHKPVFIVRAFSSILEKNTEIFLKKVDVLLKGSVDDVIEYKDEDEPSTESVEQ